MKLMTKEIARSIPALYETDETPMDDKVIQCKFFDPMGSWTWYVFEANAITSDGTEVPLRDAVDYEDIRFFGYVEGLENEAGYFTLNELESVGKSRMLGIERDLYFDRKPFGEI